MSTNTESAVGGVVVGTLPPALADAVVKKAHTVEVKKTEIVDRGREGKFIFAPYEVRHHIFTYLDVEDLFEGRFLGIVEENLPDLQRRQYKNLNMVPVITAIGRLEELKSELNALGYGGLDDHYQNELDKFISILETEKVILDDKLKSTDLSSEITCEELVMLLNAKGTAFAYNDGEVTFGFISQGAQIMRGFGAYVQVTGLVHVNLGEGIKAVQHRFDMPYFNGPKPLKETGISMLAYDKELFEKLVARGKKYVELTEKPAYRRYSGVVTRRSWWSDRKYKADGRVMVDVGAMRNMDPDYSYYFGKARYGGDEKNTPKLTVFTDEQYAAMSPYVYGFSFASKTWGEMVVDAIEEIKFRDDAYDMLVMKKSRKDKVFALVDNNVAGAKDFIDGKGGGCIFLLAGPPGGGKTLTAEAIAERLKRPLYMVGVGELGTDVASLEESLRKILDVATTWNAVLLIDECDIFMEERSEMDVERNAMVGVFLRLLEYYEGVLFLTTNRAENIDPAFYSRISMALYYDPLDVDARKIVWGNLLKIYGIQGINVDQLAHYDLNGRKIKGVIRIAKALAAADGRTPTVDDFTGVIDEEQEFQKSTGRKG